MNAKTDKIVKDLYSTIRQADKKGTAGYDTTAEVVRVEGDTAWVHIPGGVDETPVKLTIGAKKGDSVQVRVSGGTAWLVGNASAPPTDDTAALTARQAADSAVKSAKTASVKADEATRDAAIARDAAVSAQSAADQAVEDASRAQISANDAAIAASDAHTSANDAADAADIAMQKADAAMLSAVTAQEMAEDAIASAEDASGAATRANSSANDALTQLSTVEDVIGTLEWIQEHGEDSIADYIQSHLALTGQGLYVLSDSSGYKLLLSANGAVVYDPAGKAVSTFGESITFDSDRPQTIGGENAYLMYYDTDNDGKADSILISGNVTFGNMSLSDVLNNINNTNDFKDLYAGYITIDPNEPSIKLGKTNEPFAVKITDARLSFLVDTSELAYADSNVFAVDTGKYREMRMRSKNTTSPGEHTWFARDNGHLSLKLLEEN